jgi:hypothetical protein
VWQGASLPEPYKEITGPTETMDLEKGWPAHQRYKEINGKSKSRAMTEMVRATGIKTSIVRLKLSEVDVSSQRLL